MTQQLQLGPLETMPPQAPPEEQVLARPNDPLDIGGDLADPLDYESPSYAPPDPEQLGYAADIYTLASGNSHVLKPSDILAALETDIGSPEVAMALQELRQADSAEQRQQMLDMLANPRVAVDAKLELAQAFDELQTGRKYDVNAVQRAALHQLVAADMELADTAEDAEVVEIATEEVENIPENVSLAEEAEAAGYTEEELRDAYYYFLDQEYNKASEGASFLNYGLGGMFGGYSVNPEFIASILPFRLQLPVQELLSAAGYTGDDLASGSALPGEGLRMLRELYEGMSLEEKSLFFEKFLQVTRKNAGIFADGNDFISLHMMSEIFHSDLYEQSYDEASLRLSALGKYNPIGMIGIAAEALTGRELTYGRILDNAVGMLDVIGAGELARGTLKLGAKVLPSSVRRLNRASPRTAAEIAALILRNPDMAKRFGGSSAVEWAESILPSHRSLLNDGSIDGAIEAADRQLRIAEELRDIAGRTTFTAQERAAAADEWAKLLREGSAARPAGLHLGKTEVTLAGDELSVKGVFGKDESTAFPSVAAAIRGAVDTFGDGVKFRVMQLKGGKLVEVPATTKGRGRFFFEVNDVRRSVDSLPSTTGRLLVDGEEIHAWRLTAPGKDFMRLWNAIRHVGSAFGAKTVADVSAIPRTRMRWERLSEQLLSVYHSLPRHEQAVVNALLKEGQGAKTSSGVGHTFTIQELKARGVSNAAAVAYMETRGAMDILHGITNARVRAQMQAAGAMQVVLKNGGGAGYVIPRATFGEVLADNTAAGRGFTQVFDPATGKYSTLTPADVERLYAEGKSLGRMNAPLLSKGGDEATHMLIDPKAGTRTRELPFTVLNKIEGYYPRMYESNYVVYGTTKGGNRVAIGLARSPTEAADAVARLKTSKRAAKTFRPGRDGKPEISYDFDRSLRDPTMRSELLDDMYLNLGGPVYGERGGKALLNFSKDAGDHVVDPIEAMIRGMELVGSQVTKGELVQHMRTRLANFIKNEGIKTANPYRSPLSGDEILDTAGKSKEVAKARVYLDQINLIELVPNAVDAHYSMAVRGLAGALEDASRGSKWWSRIPGMGRLVKEVTGGLASAASKGLDPAGVLMAVGHRAYIAGAPFVQLPLQVLQTLMMLGVSPRAYASAWRKSLPVATVWGMRRINNTQGVPTNWDAVYKAAARAAGMEKDEFVKLIDAFDRSGLLDAVQHNNMIRASSRSASEARRLASAQGLSKGVVRDLFGRAIRTADNAVFGTLSKIGFELGENINQTITFFTLYSRDKAKGLAKLDNPDYVRDLVGRTAEYTGNMIPEAGFSYQRGWLKAAMQFVGWQHKYVLMTMPKFAGGNRVIPAADKAGMAATMFLFYGTAGLGITELIRKQVEKKIDAMELPTEEKLAMLQEYEKLRPLLDGYLADYTTNAVLKSVYGPDTPDFDVSARLAPGTGVEYGMERLHALATGGFAEWFGLGGTKTGELYKWAKRMAEASLAQANDYDEMPLNERAAVLANEGAGVMFSQYNKVLAVRAAEAMEHWVSAGGDISVPYSGDVEGVLYKFFGIDTKDKTSYYEARQRYQERLESDLDFRDKELQDLAGQYFNRLVFESLKAKRETTSDEHFDLLMSRWFRQQNMLFSMLPRQDAERVSALVAERIEKARKSRDPATVEFIEAMDRNIRDVAFGEMSDDAASYLMRSDFVQSDTRLLTVIFETFREANDAATAGNEEESE